METLTTILQPKLEKLTPEDYASLRFGDFYQRIPSLPKAPKQAFVEAIAELCKVSQQTVRMWAAGIQRPDALKQERIAEYMGVPVSTLFPPKALCEQ
ncbi:helix-turn-helix transcriptional regulator [Muribaculum intestinale]|uniref:helix-turn-helix transcriptional regulator n=1 Tax=Muribaculum intestinale TaxID=1796646 RepID=UPI00242BFE74|nr:helix-turn-helix transcriptional regulator [Muribaculum intestinale]